MKLGAYENSISFQALRLRVPQGPNSKGSPDKILSQMGFQKVKEGSQFEKDQFSLRIVPPMLGDRIPFDSPETHEILANPETENKIYKLLKKTFTIEKS
ncbi:MAG TPA: hypothetical protein PLG15_00215 [Candidatus Gastranaerophilaceae bacterium]|nr:hypothetical protein [Candidatus Gastranaerophilaceae bacterium]HPT40790.1 hypothetical protein [Candidatus Gastranaerophilaceae bacterium]